jgi:RNA polymerase sigma factor (sigma-70 family)
MAKKINGINNFSLDENFILVCDTEKPFEIKALRRVIKHALAQLSERDRTMLMMRYYMDCSGREIATFLEIPENQVASYMIRAKNRLKVLLDRVIEG